MRLVFCDNALRWLTGHNRNLAHGLRLEATRRCLPVEILGHRDASPLLVEELHARPVFRHSPYEVGALHGRDFRLLALATLGRRFEEDLASAELRRDDLLLLPNAQPAEIYGVARWLEAGGDVAGVAANMMEDDLRPRRDGALRLEWAPVYGLAIGRLARQLGRRLLLTSASHAIVERVGTATGHRIELVPMLKDYPEWAGRPQARNDPPKVGCLGNPRPEKGALLLPAIARGCLERGVRARLVIQSRARYEHRALAEAFAELAGLPNVELVEGPLTRDRYYATVAAVDVALIPYLHRFGGRTSGVFSEATALGKPSVTTRGTWMAEQIARGGAAGIVTAPEPEAVVAALAEALSGLPRLSAEARRLAPAWRATQSLSAFLDRILAELAAAGVELRAR